MISCQGQKRAISEGLDQDPRAAPPKALGHPLVPYIQKVVQQRGVFVDDQLLDLEGWGGGEGRYHGNSTDTWVKAQGGQQQLSPSTGSGIPPGQSWSGSLLSLSLSLCFCKMEP